MAGRVRHLLNRNGRYFARLAVPKDLRPVVKKVELRTPLGGDYRQALKLLPGAVALLQHEIAVAERKAGQARQGAGRYPLAPEQIALSHYTRRLAFDDELRSDWRYASLGYIDDVLVQRLRDAIAGKATDGELASLAGEQIARYRSLGNIDAAPGSDEWRTVAHALCVAEYEALERVAERDDGDFTGTPKHPLIAKAAPPEEPPERVSLSGLWEEYKAQRINAGFMRGDGKREDPVVAGLVKFVRHDDAARLTKKDILSWRDHLMTSLSAKTVNDVHLSTVRSLLNWAVENDLLPGNVAGSVRQPKPRKQHVRERGFNDEEALEVLVASRCYLPRVDAKGSVREKAGLINAKRWAPLICAFTGARITEITQLRKQDVRQEKGHWVIRITPEAGTVKAGGYRDVPLHRQIIAEGFLQFVNDAPSGPLFHTEKDPKKYAQKAGQLSNQIATWLRERSLRPEGLQPNHAWRHRFKTQCRELGLSDRVADAIQGHAGKTASDNYGDVTLKTKVEAIERLPAYQL